MKMDLFEQLTKEEIAIQRIKEFEPTEGYYIAFSGGKDSIVMYDLVKKSGVKFDIHFSLTSVDPKELLLFVKQYYPEVILDKPKMNMWQLIEKNKMPPTQLVRYCCRYLKERGGEGRFKITGIRRQESYKRSRKNIIDVCNKGGKIARYLHPIIDWSEQEIWAYIKKNNMPYCKLYDEGFKRIGCIGCPMGSFKQRNKQFERWPEYKKAYINVFSKITTTKHPTGEEWFSWWINKRSKIKIDHKQIEIFAQ